MTGLTFATEVAIQTNSRRSEPSGLGFTGVEGPPSGRIDGGPLKPCPNPLCVAGIVRMHYLPFAHSNVLHTISFDCIVCDGTALAIPDRAS